MPARKAEVDECIHLGVIIHELSDPIEVFDYENNLRVKCKKTKLVKVDEYDRGTIVDDEGIFELDCDLMVMAIGSSIKKLNFDGLALDTQGRIIVDEYFQTNIDRVYAAGDIVSGTKTVIHALSAGKQAAENIIERFREDK